MNAISDLATPPRRDAGWSTDWTFNVGQLDPHGRILLPVRAVHPDDARGLPRVDGRVDLTSRSGHHVRLRRSGLQQLLGHDGHDDVLMDAGVVTTEDGWFRIDPAATLQSLHAEWASGLQPPACAADWELVRRMQRGNKAPKGLLPPPAALRELGRLFGAHDAYDLFQLRSLISVPHCSRAALFAAIRDTASTGDTDEAMPAAIAAAAPRRPRMGPDWSHSLASHDAEGRILMSARLLHPDDGHVADDAGLVDLKPLSATPVRMRREGVRRLLGCLKATDTLAEAGILTMSDDAARAEDQYFLVDPADTLRTLYLRWEAAFPVPITPHDFKLAKRVRRACQVPDGHWPPQAVITGAARILGVREHYSSGEVRGLVTLSTSNATEVVIAIKREAGRLYVISAFKAGARPVSAEELARRVPYLKDVPETCFDPDDDDDEYRSPDATTRARLATITVLFDAAATFAYTRAPSIRLPELLPRYMRSIRRFEQEALADDPDFDPTDEASLRRARDHVAFGELQTRYPAEARDQVVRDTLYVLRHARRSIADIDPDGTRGLLASQPAALADATAFFKLLDQRYGSKRAGQRKRRKKYSDRIANRYERVIDAAAFRVGQVSKDGDAARAAIDHLEKPGNAHLAYKDFEVEDDDLSERGLPVGSRHERLYRCWRVAAAELSVELGLHPDDEPPAAGWPGPDAQRQQARIEQRSRRKDTDGKGGRGKPLRLHGGQYIVEFLGIRPLTSGRSAFEPWYVTLAKHHSLSATGLLDAGQKALRDALAKRWRLPAHVATCGGLVSFDSRRARVAREASRTSLAHHRTFVPIEEFEHAVRLVGHGLDCVVQTWCRSGEFRQQTEYKEDWDPLPDGKQFGWRYIPKLAPGAPIPDPLAFHGVGEDTRDEAMNLVAILVRRCHPEGFIPDVQPIEALKWKCAAQPYIFSCAGRMVDAKTLGYALRLLFANVGEFRFHDFRHAGSNQARDADKPLIMIQAGLKQRRMANADYYSELTILQLARRHRTAIDDKLKRIAHAEKRRRSG